MITVYEDTNIHCVLIDFQNFCTAGERIKFATKSYDITHLTLDTLLYYLGKL